jgi:hypothetical protein
MKIELCHYRTLLHLKQVMCIFGWDEYDDTLRELEAEEMVKGEWSGSLDYEPHPVWTLLDKGRKALDEYIAEHP